LATAPGPGKVAGYRGGSKVSRAAGPRGSGDRWRFGRSCGGSPGEKVLSQLGGDSVGTFLTPSLPPGFTEAPLSRS